MLMYSVLNKLSEYIYFYISKNHYIACFKIVKSLQCILKVIINLDTNKAHGHDNKSTLIKLCDSVTVKSLLIVNKN